MKIAYLGPDGSYSFCAAKKYCRELDGMGGEMSPQASFANVILSVEQGKADIGILPLENSTEGIVTPVVDLLYYANGISMVAEVVIPIHHCLLNESGRLQDIKYIYSNQQPLEQCKLNLAKLVGKASLIECESSSAACKIAKKNGKEFAAVANEVAGELYGLQAAVKDLQDNDKNATRFVAIKLNGETRPSGNDKTSIAFTFDKDRPGSLYLVLKEFAECGINLSRIESRPMKEELGKYVFYIDFAGHKLDDGIIELMDKVRQVVGELKILGSYRLATKMQDFLSV